MEFPHGKAPLAILILALLAGASVLAFSLMAKSDGRPDLILATFTKEHAEVYKAALPEFEKKFNCKVQIQIVSQKALQGRLQSAMQVGAEVPDLVEVLYGTMGVFTKGPLEDVGFVDLTDKLHQSGLYDRLVQARFSLWTSRGRIFAMPHDCHPVMLVYRRDLLEQLGIKPEQLTTWDDFTRIGREVVTKDLNGDGVIDRYMFDLSPDGNDALLLLILQRGGELFNEKGDVAFDSDIVLDTICWYARQCVGKDRISTTCGWGQTLSRAMMDGLCLFYCSPDWRTKQIENDIPALSGKLGLMPLPAWTPGGIRTSIWGGTGLAITKQCQKKGKFDLAWELSQYLYYDKPQLGVRFAGTNILPPLKEAWDLPVFDRPNPYYSNMAVGREYAKLAPFVPPERSSPYRNQALGKLNEAYINCRLYLENNGENGFREFARAELSRCAQRVREIMARNVFLSDETATPTGSEAGSR